MNNKWWDNIYFVLFMVIGFIMIVDCCVIPGMKTKLTQPNDSLKKDCVREYEESMVYMSDFFKSTGCVNVIVIDGKNIQVCQFLHEHTNFPIIVDGNGIRQLNKPYTER